METEGRRKSRGKDNKSRHVSQPLRLKKNLNKIFMGK
jgi:hypothetical protein